MKLKKFVVNEWFGWCDVCHPTETDYNAHWQGKNAGMVAKRHAQLTRHITHAIQELMIRWEPE
jgi:hypothetical protein